MEVRKGKGRDMSDQRRYLLAAGGTLCGDDL